MNINTNVNTDLESWPAAIHQADVKTTRTLLCYVISINKCGLKCYHIPTTHPTCMHLSDCSSKLNHSYCYVQVQFKTKMVLLLNLINNIDMTRHFICVYGQLSTNREFFVFWWIIENIGTHHLSGHKTKDIFWTFMQALKPKHFPWAGITTLKLVTFPDLQMRIISRSGLTGNWVYIVNTMWVNMKVGLYGQYNVG